MTWYFNHPYILAKHCQIDTMYICVYNPQQISYIVTEGCMNVRGGGGGIRVCIQPLRLPLVACKTKYSVRSVASCSPFFSQQIFCMPICTLLLYTVSMAYETSHALTKRKPKNWNWLFWWPFAQADENYTTVNFKEIYISFHFNLN